MATAPPLLQPEAQTDLNQEHRRTGNSGNAERAELRWVLLPSRFQSSSRLKQENVHVNVDAEMEKSFFRNREQFSCT